MKNNGWLRRFKRGQPFAILLQAAWFGLFFGYAEVVYNLLLKYVRHIIILQSQHFIWMIPFTLLLVFLALGVVWMTLAAIWPRLNGLNWITAYYIFFGLMAIYYVKPKISLWAALLLAAGISIQAGRIVASRSDQFDRIVKKTIPWMALALLTAYGVMRMVFP